MLTIKQDTGISYNFIANKYTNIPFEQSLFFDIETTGFTAKNTKLYLIGCLYADKSTGHFISVQWFLDNHKDFSLVKQQQMFPGKVGQDGFFIAKFVRN